MVILEFFVGVVVVGLVLFAWEVYHAPEVVNGKFIYKKKGRRKWLKK